jgi:hypothetical protein
LIAHEVDELAIAMCQLEAQALLALEDVSVRSQESRDIRLNRSLNRGEIVVANEAFAPSPPRGVLVVESVSSTVPLIAK